MFSTIVHPTDLSEASIPALQSAHQLAKELNSKLVVCFIAHTPLVAEGSLITNPESKETRNIAEELDSFQSADPEVERELRIVITDKSTRIRTLLKFLENMSCDLLVMGMHKHAGVVGWLASSITEEVVRRAGCAVLVVKQHGTEYQFEEAAENAGVDPDSGQ